MRDGQRVYGKLTSSVGLPLGFGSMSSTEKSSERGRSKKEQAREQAKESGEKHVLTVRDLAWRVGKRARER